MNQAGFVCGTQKPIPESIRPHGLAVYEYLRTRVETSNDPGRRIFQHWQPIKYESMLTEFRDLVDFARFCADHTGEKSPIAAAFKSSSNIWINVKRNISAQDLLAHLDAKRQRWQELRGDETPAPPSSLKHLALSSADGTSASTTSLSIEEIECLIDREQNLIFRALWILLAYAGPRLSESLHMWVCDVLDAMGSVAELQLSLGLLNLD